MCFTPPLRTPAAITSGSTGIATHPLKIFILARPLSLSLVIIVRKFSTIHESFSSKIYIYIYCILYHPSSILIKICLRSRSSTRSVLLFSRDRIKMAVVRTEKRIKKKVDPSKMDAHVSDYNPCVSIRTEAGRLP